MKKILRFAGVVSGLVIYLSCQKEINEFGEQKTNCRLSTAYYYNASGVFYDSSVFSYSGDKVMEAESVNKLITYGYAGSNIYTRTYFDKFARSNSFSDSIEYDGSNRIKKITLWLYPGQFSSETRRIIYMFTYKGNNIDQVTSIRMLTSTLEDTLINQFRVNGAGNIDNIVTVDFDGNVHDSVHYSYDNNPNYFAKIHPNYFIFDVNFQLQGQYLHHLPYFLSKNNVIEFSYGGTFTYQVGYEQDSLRNLSSVKVSGQPYTIYKYDCR
jgi:hypothetical protein